MNINLLSLSNNKKSSQICVKYGSEDVYTAGKSANCDLTPNWAQFISVAGQRLYTIQRRRPISARGPGGKESQRSRIRLLLWHSSFKETKFSSLFNRKY